MGPSGSAEEEDEMVELATVDVTVAAIDSMEPIHGGLARRARSSLGVTAWGMQVFTLPANWDGYPEHTHDENAFDPNQEEVYVPLAGSATLVAGREEFELAPGMMARVGPSQPRRIVPGPEGVRLLALGGRPGTFDPPSWTELGAPPPMPE
jgi:mannose-6-phosphate isomerase-like protein (cupin superfamily)